EANVRYSATVFFAACAAIGFVTAAWSLAPGTAVADEQCIAQICLDAFMSTDNATWVEFPNGPLTLSSDASTCLAIAYFDGTAHSLDPNKKINKYTWQFGDQTTETKTYAAATYVGSDTNHVY